MDGEALYEKRCGTSAGADGGLAFFKGKWVEVNHKKLRELLKRMDGMDTSITLREALQMEIGNGKKISADVGALRPTGHGFPKCCAICENHPVSVRQQCRKPFMQRFVHIRRMGIRG